MRELGTMKKDGVSIAGMTEGGSGGSQYELPIASASTLGGVKIGTGVNIDSGGVISVDETPIATTSTAGKVKPDGTSITVTQDGTISASGGVRVVATSTGSKTYGQHFGSLYSDYSALTSEEKYRSIITEDSSNEIFTYQGDDCYVHVVPYYNQPTISIIRLNNSTPWCKNIGFGSTGETTEFTNETINTTFSLCVLL